MHNLRLWSFFFIKNTIAPEGDTLFLMWSLSSISFNCNLRSTNSGVLILYGPFDVGVPPTSNSIENSTSLRGRKSEISTGNTSWNHCKTRYSQYFLHPQFRYLCHWKYVLHFTYIAVTILTGVYFFLSYKTLCSPFSSKHSISFS